MIVYAHEAVVFCTKECAQEYLTGQLEMPVPKLSSAPMPMTHSNPVVNAALERLCCDRCGYNLRDLAR